MQTAFIRNVTGDFLEKILDLIKTFPGVISIQEFPEKINAGTKMIFCKLPDKSFSKFKSYIEKDFTGIEVQEGQKL